MKIFAIAAMDEGRVIGADNGIPWRLPEDIKRFAALTTGHAVLMGRKTYESLPPKFRPLPKRLNIVVSRSGFIPAEQGVIVCASVNEVSTKIESGEIRLPSDILWVIGGAQIYGETLSILDELYLTVLHSKHAGDAFFPPFEEDFQLISDERSVSGEGAQEYSFRRYAKKK